MPVPRYLTKQELRREKRLKRNLWSNHKTPIPLERDLARQPARITQDLDGFDALPAWLRRTISSKDATIFASFGASLLQMGKSRQEVEALIEKINHLFLMAQRKEVEELAGTVLTTSTAMTKEAEMERRKAFFQRYFAEADEEIKPKW
jgi:hypothetical protein